MYTFFSFHLWIQSVHLGKEEGSRKEGCFYKTHQYAGKYEGQKDHVQLQERQMMLNVHTNNKILEEVFLIYWFSNQVCRIWFSGMNFFMFDTVHMFGSKIETSLLQQPRQKAYGTSRANCFPIYLFLQVSECCFLLFLYLYISPY